LIEEGLRYADAMEQSHCAHIMAATGALVAWADGRWDEAITRGERALADRGCKRGEVMARWPVGYTALGRGELAEGASQLLAAEAFAEASGVPDMLLAASWGLAELALLAGDHEDAIARTDRALEVARRSRELGRFAPFAVTGVRARLAAGRPGDAEQWLSDASELLREAPSCASPAVDHAAGLLALGTGSLGAARASLQLAVRGWEGRGRTWEGLWARLDLAACLMRFGRTVEAMSLVAEVRGAAERLRSQPLLERAEAIERLGRQRRVEQSAWYPLTAREYEVARLVGRGMTNREIAAELAVAPRTVSAHVEHVLAKLGAARRAEIASWVAAVAPVGHATDWASSPMDPEPSIPSS
jgi:DNA-binding CsgD family transcriptional regulator